MTEVGDKSILDWERYPAINWTRLGRAHAFFEAKGYSYMEVPWAVPRHVVDLTLPEGSIPISAGDTAEILVGSAEQGFLHKRLEKQLSKEYPYNGNLYFSISPCFRGESHILPGHTQKCFMKLELLSFWRHTEEANEASLFLLDDAEQFMTTEGAHLTRIKTEAGIDLECAGVEVGSYGVRSCKNLRSRDEREVWAYATGLAEPRFSTALAQQQKKRDNWNSRR